MANSSTLLWKCKHLSYVNEIASKLSCDLSDFSWKLLLKKEDLDHETMQVIVSLGAVISIKVVKSIIKEVDAHKVSLLKLAIEKCSPALSAEDINSLGEEALRRNKIRFFMEFYSHGATADGALIVNKMTVHDLIDPEITSHLKSTSEGCVNLFNKAVEMGKLEVAEDFLRESKDTRSQINLCLILHSLIKRSKDERWKYISFIEKLLTEFQINPDSIDDAECPLDIVLKLSKDYWREKVQLLSLLINHGASIAHCTFPRQNQTTLLHIATNFAIESGTM